MSITELSTSLPLLEDINRLIGGDRPWGGEIIGFRSIDSTNTLARRWAAEGAPEGSIVIAEHQSAGKGRLGRRWQAASGQNILFSIVLRPGFLDDRRGLITLAASVAVADTIETVTSPHQPTIKWPNDIILDSRKCCGMLLETTPASDDGSRKQAVILGVGLNVNQITFPPALRDEATSLQLVTGRLVERAPLFIQLATSINDWYRRLLEGGETTVRSAFETRMLNTGQSVTLQYTDDHSSLEGVIEGIDETGGLRLRHAGGCETVHAGEVTFRSVED